MDARADPLASARRKLIRANKHLRALDEEVRRFRDSKPYTMVRDFDPETGEHRSYAVKQRDPDDEVSLILGDLVHNLRSALDHAVFGCSEFFQERRLTEDDAKSVEFPIYTDPAKWPAGGPGGIRFLPKNLRQAIQAIQPYHGPEGNARLNHPLAVLYTMSNADKHRELLLAGVVAPTVVGVGVSREASESHRFTPPIVENGSIVSRVAASLDPNEHLDPIIEMQITLKVGGPVWNPIATLSPIEGLTGSMYNQVNWVVNAVFGAPQTFQPVMDGGPDSL